VRRTGRPIYNRRMYPPDDGQDVIGNGDQRDRPDRRWPWRPGWAGRGTSVIAGLALAVGLIAGYLGGHQPHPTAPTPRPTAPTPRPTKATSPPSSQAATPQDAFPDLTATGNRCALQRGTTLQLGVEVVNESDHTLAVGRFGAVLPVGGLRATAATVGTCGALPVWPPISPTLPAGQTVWLTITFHVLVRCPQPYPVQFVVSYTDSGKLATTQMDEFPDLSQVAYSGCPAAEQFSLLTSPR
jgi:hypothetical protein